MDHLKPTPANSPPLTPLGYLERAATVYGECASVVYGGTTYTWADTHDRCLRIASSLLSYGIERGQVVSVLAPNTPAAYELHFAVPMCGAVLNNINTRLDPRTISVLLSHGESKLVFVDYQLSSVLLQALALLPPSHPRPRLVLIEEADQNLKIYNNQDGIQSQVLSNQYLTTYEEMIKKGDSNFRWVRPKSEWDPIVLNYTSGTTSAPKGVVHSHRGAFIMSMDALIDWSVPKQPVYLWTLPMFHANGWSFTWGMAAVGATNICLRKFDGPTVFATIRAHNVTHMCGAPVVLNMLSNRDVGVIDPDTGKPVPKDGKSVGEIVLRGGFLMLGYLKDPKATSKCMGNDGWFKTGDVGVMHQDGYLEIKDRSKDIIISGGENISSVEVESVIYGFPGVNEAAVVARPDEYWGETPCAFVSLKEGVENPPTDQDVIDYCRAKLPHYMVPKTVVIKDELPKTSTGKIQKFVLRDMAKALGPSRHSRPSRL